MAACEPYAICSEGFLGHDPSLPKCNDNSEPSWCESQCKPFIACIFEASSAAETTAEPATPPPTPEPVAEAPGGLNPDCGSMPSKCMTDCVPYASCLEDDSDPKCASAPKFCEDTCGPYAACGFSQMDSMDTSMMSSMDSMDSDCDSPSVCPPYCTG